MEKVRIFQSSAQKVVSVEGNLRPVDSFVYVEPTSRQEELIMRHSHLREVDVLQADTWKELHTLIHEQYPHAISVLAVGSV